MNYDSTPDTLEHIRKVRERLDEVIAHLELRAGDHDASKLEEPEKSAFDGMGRRKFAINYDSDEYKTALAQLQTALAHHYEVNRHHPQHWPNGINDMSLLDIIEMFCDWEAAGQDYKNGSLEQSLTVNKERFGISDQLASIFENTRKELGWI